MFKFWFRLGIYHESIGYDYDYKQGVQPLVKVKFKDFSRTFKALFQ